MARALAICDDVTTCQCCGKSDLKCTVAIELDCGEVVYYGRTCAARNTGKAARKINAEIRDEAERRLKAARLEYQQTPEYRAMEQRFAERPRGLVGAAASDFVEAAVLAAEAVRNEIAERYGVRAVRLA